MSAQRRLTSAFRMSASVLLLAFLIACDGPDRTGSIPSGSAAAPGSTSAQALSAGTPSLGGVSTGVARPTQVQGPAVRSVSAGDLVEDLAASLENGRASTADALRNSGLEQAVDDILRLDGFQSHDLSSEALVRELHRRAEVFERGQGERVLTHLYRQAEAEYGAVVTDPSFERLRTLSRELSPEALDPRGFRFATAAQARGVTVPLSPALESAVRQLSYVYAQPNLSQLRGLATRHFGNPAFDFDRILAESTDSRDAVRRMIRAGTPPPSPEVATERIMLETLSQNGTLRGDRQFIEAIHDLRPELELDALDESQRRYVQSEDRIASRRAQLAEAERAGLPGKVAKSSADDVYRAARPATAVSRAAQARSQSAQHFANYVGSSFEPPDAPGFSAPSGGGGGGGGGGGAPNGRSTRSYNASRSYTTTAPPSTYARRVGSAPRVSRSFRGAIRSARAARGIAAGGAVTSSVSSTPVTAAWVSNREDDRFGRLVVGFGPDTQGRQRLAASRTLFADSFYPAVSVLWGGHHGVTAFEEGNILVLQSMDPFDEVGGAMREALVARSEDLERRAIALAEDDYLGELALFEEMMELQRDAAMLPRRIVFHPALFGRELSWSAARVDFWFNDIEGLSTESAATNGGRPMPAVYRSIDLSGASTWQFFERDASVVVRSGQNGVDALRVVSGGPVEGPPSERSHFGVSMFVFEDSDPEGTRLPELESELQPMLDWLATNHHDFIRLNDFSESFSLLRWLRGNDVAPILLDMDGDAQELGTPSLIVIGDGPKIGS